MIRATVRVGWKSIAGQRHRAEGRENEDALVVSTEHPLLDAVLVVADGMGGHPLPRAAATAAAQAAEDYLNDRARLNEDGRVGRWLEEAVDEARRHVLALGEDAGDGKPPGTTLTVAAVAGGALHVAHVGDGSVFLYRDGTARRVVGGEERRFGNRPENFLGSPTLPDVETASVPLEVGDRILICTDGLTRYFSGERGMAGIAGILGRAGADPPAIAAQLTAHSRGDEYDDDTSVVVAEVTDLRNTAAPRAARSEPRRAGGRRRGASWPGVIAGALVGAGLLAIGFAAGRAGRPAAPPPGGDQQPPPAAQPQPASPAELAALPKGNVILVDDVHGRAYVLRTTPNGPPPSGPQQLRAFRLRNGKLEQLSGIFTLDGSQRQLADPQGRAYPVATDPESGMIQVLRGGRLVIRTQPPGAACWIDGRSAKTPVNQLVAAGPHLVRVEGYLPDTMLQVPAERALTLDFGSR